VNRTLRYLVSLVVLAALAFVLSPAVPPRSAQAQPKTGGATYGGSIYGGGRYGGNVNIFAKCFEQLGHVRRDGTRYHRRA
jgi:hypothetical protein